MNNTKERFCFIWIFALSGFTLSTYFGVKSALISIRQDVKILNERVSIIEEEIEAVKKTASINKNALTEVENKKFDPLLQYFPEDELKIIRKEAIENHCTGELFYVLLAIRKAEGGRKGLEFGVLHPKARNTNLEVQAGWASATVAKNYQRWKNAGCPDDFIIFLGNRYCPVGADNDPDGLNKYWITNVKYWYAKLRE